MTIIEARGVKHRIEFRVDHISNQPKIAHTTEPSPIEVGQIRRALAARRTCGENPPVDSILGAYPTPSLGSASGRGLRMVQSASDLARAVLRARVRQLDGDQARLGQVAAARSDLGALVRRPQIAALSRRPCRSRPRPRAEPHRARLPRRVSWPLGKRRSAAGARRGRLLASIAGQFLRRRTGQSRWHHPASGGDEENTRSRSIPFCSA